ncbi:hypothetical protein ACHAP8_007210 [Fusarium lateritium]
MFTVPAITSTSIGPVVDHDKYPPLEFLFLFLFLLLKSIPVTSDPTPPCILSVPQSALDHVDDLKADTVTLNAERKFLISQANAQVSDCASDCTDLQLQILDFVQRDHSGVPWSNLPANVQEALSADFKGPNYQRESVKFAVEDLKAIAPLSAPANAPASTPAIASDVEKAYGTPLSLGSTLSAPQVPQYEPRLTRSAARKVAQGLSTPVDPSPTARKAVPSKRKTDVDNSASSKRDDASEDYDDDVSAQVTINSAVVKKSKPKRAVKPITLEPIVVDGVRLIRVGPQPIIVMNPVVKAISSELAKLHIAALTRGSKSTEAKYLGKNVELIAEVGNSTENEALQSLTTIRQHHQKRYCDYTGVELAWSTNPTSYSLEAFYNFTKLKGQVIYHCPPNVGSIATTLNFTKGRSSPLMLPLVSAWLNAMDENNFQVRKSYGMGIMNALGNIGLLEKAFKCHHSHVDRVAYWSDLTIDQQREGLDALRTGERTGMVDEIVTDFQNTVQTRRVLLYRATSSTFNNHTVRSCPSSIQEIEVLYDNLVNIGRKYGLSKTEFEGYCTIRRPSGAGRVFYPYHVLSQAQALAVGWDWHILYSLGGRALRAMREFCNRHAELNGQGEPDVDVTIYIYWTCHHICQKIQQVKVQRPGAKEDEIAFHILDRWGLPGVPWDRHPFRASLCKKQTHGIAMRFGIVKFEDFDPVQDIDLSQSTITVDARVTNLAMLDWEPSAWGDILEALRLVPLSHPLWRPDPNLGLTSWIAPDDTSSELAILPEPEFDFPLLPVELWVPDDDTLPRSHYPVSCPNCLATFNSIGALIHHCRHQLCLGPGADLPSEDDDDDEDEDDFLGQDPASFKSS